MPNTQTQKTLSLKTLNRANAFNPGSDLWILPELENSTLSKKADWYLNFQIYAFIHHKKREISSKLSEIMNQCELKDFEFLDSKKQKKQGLMIPSSKYFPNRWVFYLENSKAIQTWIHCIHDVWVDLNKPSLRVFVPIDFSLSEIKSKLDERGFDGEISFVVEKT